MRSIAALAVVSSLFAAPALAAQGEVCKSTAVNTPTSLANDTVFHCKAAGSGTIPELYAKGWRVVSVFSQTADMPTAKAPMGLFEWVLVVERS